MWQLIEQKIDIILCKDWSDVIFITLFVVQHVRISLVHGACIDRMLEYKYAVIPKSLGPTDLTER